MLEFDFIILEEQILIVASIASYIFVIIINQFCADFVQTSKWQIQRFLFFFSVRYPCENKT